MMNSLKRKKILFVPDKYNILYLYLSRFFFVLFVCSQILFFIYLKKMHNLKIIPSIDKRISFCKNIL